MKRFILTHAPIHPAFRRVLVVVLFFFAGWGVAAAQTQTKPRIIIEVVVNGKPVHLLFDTGSDTSSLFLFAVEKLGLKVTKPDPNMKLSAGEVSSDVTEPCQIQILDKTTTGRFAVLNPPASATSNAEGILAWQSVRKNLFFIHDTSLRIAATDALPPDVQTWQQIPISSASHLLITETPGAKGGKDRVLVDTGNPDGVSLPSDQWNAWRAAHTHAPVTYVNKYSATLGMFIAEECWADELTVGPFKLKNVPVRAAIPAESGSVGAGFQGALGLYALGDFDMVLDGVHNVLYAQPTKSAVKPYLHNRLGAVFIQADQQNNALVARVLPGSPAAKAGIKDGDALLAVNGIDTAKLMNDPNVPTMTSFWQKPAGTKLDLSLERGGVRYHAWPVLIDLLGPGLTPASPPK